MSEVKINYKSWKFVAGSAILLVLILSYLIEIPVESGPDYISYSPLLGIIIFYNPFILAFYIILSVILIIKSIRVSG